MCGNLIATYFITTVTTYFGDGKFHDALHVLRQVGVYHKQSPVVRDLTDHQTPHGTRRQHGQPRRRL